MGLILDSSVLVAFERRRFDLERLLGDWSPPAIAAVTAAELLIGVERADTPQRRARRESFVQNICARVPVIPFDLPQARLFAIHFADLARRGQVSIRVKMRRARMRRRPSARADPAMALVELLVPAPRRIPNASSRLPQVPPSARISSVRHHRASCLSRSLDDLGGS